MRVGVDMDGVLADFAWGMVAAMEGRGWKRSPRAGDTWEMAPWFNGDDDRRKSVHMNIIATELPTFWENLKILPGAREGFYDLAHRFETYIITSLWPGSRTCAGGKLSWLRQHFPWFPESKIITCSCKEVIDVDLLFDDRLKNVMEHPNGVVFSQPWNMESNYNPRVFVWRDVLGLVRERAKGGRDS